MLTAEKRTRTDRRARPSPPLSRYTFHQGKRSSARRKEDTGKHLFVDLYGRRLFVALTLLFVLNCVDAYLTLALIENDLAVEANPFMDFLLERGRFPFIANKFLITATGITLFCLLKNVVVVRKVLLPLSLFLYFSTILYELYLFGLA
ncbi:MAG: DUF5658 family protein [Alphaproteobacteria bacterium]|uniref:DUF5658 family protein n=1 Tax=Candidatus Nitrobium versatile TaxID=2884831 RepID=A0A953M077_9BACT|nr:DUF5658 family protein [Candidatus Nitrobium versatile]